MKIKELIIFLKKYDDEREVVLHYWNGENSKFFPLSPAVTPTANTKNLLVLIEDKLNIETIR